MARQRRDSQLRARLRTADGAVLDVAGSGPSPWLRVPEETSTHVGSREARRLLDGAAHAHVLQSIDRPHNVREQVLRQREILRALHAINVSSSNETV